MLIFAEDAVKQPAEFCAVGVGSSLETFYFNLFICAEIGEMAYRWMGGVGKCVVFRFRCVWVVQGSWGNLNWVRLLRGPDMIQVLSKT